MNYVRSAKDRGTSDYGWLQSRHTFSFGGYHDPEHMGFSALRVINDDVVAAGAGFGAHGHRDMEIISFVLEGALRHEDSTGNRYVVPAGDIQLMSAGAGIVHSELNDSDAEPVSFLQIWIEPNVRGTEPSYAQHPVTQTGQLTPLVTADGRDGSLTARQDMSMYLVSLDAGETLDLNPAQGKGFLHVVSGTVSAGRDALEEFDGLGFAEPLAVRAQTPLQALYFDLPA